MPDMDELAQNLLTALKKPSASLDSKLQLFNTLKYDIKHQCIPETAQATVLECVRLAISSQTSSTLVTAGFSTLSHLIKRLVLQEQAHNVFNARTHIIPTLLERLGDAKESYRSAASQSLADLWPVRQLEVEKAIREGAILGSTNVRTKETGIAWVTKMHEEHKLQFKSFVPPLVECLDHADGTVRDAAKNNLVELFRNAPDRAKADLKRQLLAHNVRKSIAAFILSHLALPVPSELAAAVPTTSQSHLESSAPDNAMPDPASATEPVLPPSADTSNIEPLYADSQRQLDDIFRDMAPNFEGRESETNWMPRDSGILKLRRLLRGNAPTEFHTVLLAHIKHMLEGILKVVNSLRTTMSTNGCQLVQEMARTLGPALDPMVEILLQNGVKLCSATKQIASQNGQALVDVLLSHVTYNVRLLQHVWFAAQDKNTQPRIYSSGWLKTILKRQTHSKTNFEHSGGLELAEKIIKKGLADANPKVREGMRGTFWAFNATWTDKAEAIMSSLDAKSRQLLEKDPGNPNGSSAAFTSSVGPSGSGPNPRAAASRGSLKDTIAAQKKAAMLAAKRLPDRPNSAMATLSPVKPAGGTTRPMSTIAAKPAATSASTTRPKTTTSTTSSSGHSSLMSGPVRRPKRHEVPRPATADPYAAATRRLGRAETPPSRSPGNSPARPMSRAAAGSANHTKNRSTTALRPGTSDSEKSTMTTSPRITPSKTRPITIHGGDSAILRSSPSMLKELGLSPRAAGDEHATVGAPGGARRVFHAMRGQNENERPRSNHSDLPSMAEEEDNFTLVMPEKGGTLDFAPKADDGIHKSSRREASPMRPTRTPRRVPSSNLREASAREASAKKSGADGRTEKGPVVYEDPDAAQGEEGSMEKEVKAVLEEVPVNERHQAEEETSAGREERLAESPAKKSTSTTEMQKHRRLLSSGVERLRAHTLDAHGFRRLQELVKSSSGNKAGVESQLKGLLLALTEYVQATPEALKVAPAKAASLKSQALETLRAMMALGREEEEVQQQCGQIMCSLLRARRGSERASALNGELDKAGQEAVRSSGARARDCIDAVIDYTDAGSSEEEGGAREAIAALGLLSQLLGATRTRKMELGEERLKRLGRLAVRFLEDRNADVRRADTEFCLALQAGSAAEGLDDFWSLLQGARESQLNLVAYYLARKNSP